MVCLRRSNCLRIVPTAQRIKSENVIKGRLSGLTLFLATQSPLKTMKNAFYLTLKASLDLKIFKFVLTFWSGGKTV